MNEELFGTRVAEHLERGLEGLAPQVRARLQQARRLAVAAADRGAPAGSRAFLRRHAWLRVTVPVAAVITLLVAISVWQQMERTGDNAEVDAALLAGDLPIDAYLDERIGSWAKRSSE